jgi:hypothetical protein
MKKIIIAIIFCFGLGIFVSLIHDEKIHSPYQMYWMIAGPLSLVTIIPLLKYFFPTLKKLEFGTINFLPNIFNSFKKNN